MSGYDTQSEQSSQSAPPPVFYDEPLPQSIAAPPAAAETCDAATNPAASGAFGHYTDPPQPQSMNIGPFDPMYDLQMEREKAEWKKMDREAKQQQIQEMLDRPDPYAPPPQRPDTIRASTPEENEQFEQQKRQQEELENCEKLPYEAAELCKKKFGGDPIPGGPDDLPEGPELAE